MITRRQILGYGAVGAAALAVGPAGLRAAGPVFAAAGAAPPDPYLVDGLSKFTEALTQPPTWNQANLKSRGLTMKESVHRFHRSLGTTRTWGYGGMTYGGPTIQAVSGTPVSYTARNALGAHLLGVDKTLGGMTMPGMPGMDDQTHPRTSLHLHGGYTETASDGTPEQTYMPGESYRYNYTNDQQAASLIYHDHAMGLTRLNVYAGLVGAYLIRDPKAEVGLPTGKYDIPLLVQDKTFLGALGDASNELYYPNPWEPEFFGDVMVVNGKAWPNLNVDRGVYRFRLINGSSARFYNVHLSDGAKVIQIGSEYGLINKPLPLDSLVVAPGERAEILIDFSKYAPGTKLILKNLPLPDGVVSPGDDVLIEDIMQFTVTSGFGWPRKLIPANLRPTNPIRPLSRVNIRKRYVTLVEIMGAGGPCMALLNNRPFTTTDIEEVTVDTVEEWNIINTTADTHPIHLHLIGFQVAERQAFDVEGYLQATYGTTELMEENVGSGEWPYKAPDAFLLGDVLPRGEFEAGWKDTVQVHPGQITRLLVPFGPSAAPGMPFGQKHKANPLTGDYLWHCHILDHEDNDMMLPYKVIPKRTP
jgi:spore coat protein A, manganese oxidase